MESVNRDFKEFLELFTENGVEYLIIGGYALAFHGVPRFTGDIDIFISRSRENAYRVLKCLDKFGFAQIGLQLADFTEADQVVELGYPPVRIDIITSIDGVTWEDAWSRRVKAGYGDVPVQFISKEDFITNKLASGKKQDLADLEALGVEIST
jgi:hypothetical protein